MNDLDNGILIIKILESFTFVSHILLITGALIAANKLPPFYRHCLVGGSIMITLSALPRSIILVRMINVATYSLIAAVNRFFAPVAVLIFAIGFIGLSRKFRDLL